MPAGIIKHIYDKSQNALLESWRVNQDGMIIEGYYDIIGFIGFLKKVTVEISISRRQIKSVLTIFIRLSFILIHFDFVRVQVLYVSILAPQCVSEFDTPASNTSCLWDLIAALRLWVHIFQNDDLYFFFSNLIPVFFTCITVFCRR